MIALAVTAFAFWLLVFLVLAIANGVGLRDLLFGRLEPPPHPLGVWVLVPEASSGRASVEERWLELADGTLVRQRRTRDVLTREIIAVEPEQLVRRRRQR